MGGRRAECGCSFGPGVVRIAICSRVRLGEAWNFVQFIVLMEWIRFHCTEVKHGGEGISESRIARMPLSRKSLAESRGRIMKNFWKLTWIVIAPRDRISSLPIPWTETGSPAPSGKEFRDPTRRCGFSNTSAQWPI